MIILKAAKPTNGEDRGSREENEKKKAWDTLQHISSSMYVLFLISFLFTILTII